MNPVRGGANGDAVPAAAAGEGQTPAAVPRSANNSNAVTAAEGQASAAVPVYNPCPESPAPRALLAVGEDGGSAAGEEQTQQRGATSYGAVATLCNSAVGAGVLALPFAFRCAGLLGGLLLCVSVAAAESCSLYVLSKFAERYDAHSYGSLIRRALGRKLATALSAILLLYLAGSCIAYLIIIGDSFEALGQQFFGPSTWTDRNTILLGTVGAIILPLCFARSLTALEWVSVGAVAGFLYTSGVILWRGAQVVSSRPDPWAGVVLFQPNLRQALYSVSIMVFSFNSSANTITIFSELDPFPHRLVMMLPPSPTAYSALPRLAPRPRTHKLIGMLGVIVVAMSLIAAGYVAVGAAGYSAFPATVTSNILTTFPDGDPFMQVARGVIGTMVVFHYPLAFVPARVAFEDLLSSVWNITDVPYAVSTAFTLLFVAASLATAMVVTDLGAVLHVIGGTCASCLLFLLPGLLCWNAAVIKETFSVNNLTSLNQAVEDEDGGEGAAGSSAPLLGPLPKKAGLRTHGPLLLSARKTWWLGTAMLVLSVVVICVTLLTMGGGAE